MSEQKHLPATWDTAALAEICARLVDGSHNPPSATDVGKPMLSARNINEFQILFDDFRLISDEDFEQEHARTQVAVGDVLITIVGTIGRTAVVPVGLPAFALQRSVAVLKPRGIDSRYLAYALNTPDQQQWLVDNAKGTAQKGVYLKTLGSARIPIAPAAEQTRIVAKLEELLSDLDAGVAELKAAQKKLAQYRQSLLKAAVEGALTAPWRAAQRSAPLSPRGRGAGGEGASTLAMEDEAWLQARARELRQQQTPEEHALWQQLRAERFSGYKFRRQQPLGRFIVDFVCFAQKLIVELDGGQHVEAAEYDAHRDAWLKQEGFRVLRFWNNEWTTQQEAVLEAIWRALQETPPLPNPSPTRGEGLESETGAQLLARILSERRKRWEAKQLARFAEQGKTPPKDWQSKYPEPVAPDTTDLPQLPEGWVWASVEQLASDERYSLAIGPFGSNLRVPDYRDSGVPLIFVRNIRSGQYGGERTKYVSAEKALELRAHSVASGDVLVTKMGEPPGDADVYPDDQPLGIITADCIKIRCWPGLVQPSFLKAVINSSIGRRQIEPITQGVAQKKVSLERFSKLAVPIPPAVEQVTILELFNAADSEAATQGAAIEVALKQSTAQRKNILKAAFSGQLVPQDPADEPASVLLARIRVAREAALQKPKTRRRVAHA